MVNLHIITYMADTNADNSSANNKLIEKKF